MLIQSQLLSLLNRVLNQSALSKKAGVQAVYYCPFCNHYKRKFEINLDTQEYHCWVCNAAGKSIYSLFKKLKVDNSFFRDLNKIIPRDKIRKNVVGDNKEVIHKLPDEFWPMYKQKKISLEMGSVWHYLRGRGITYDDVVRYNIGYCETGEYSKRIIIPSYDRYGKLNFFSSRTYYENEDIIAYKNPPWDKNIIGFELFINWNLPITLVEGAFDAFSVKRNAIPLFGKTLSNKLKESIIENKVKRINIILDNDAVRESIKMMDFFNRYEIDARLIKLDGKDPSVIGFTKVNQLINNSKQFSFSDIMNIKLGI